MPPGCSTAVASNPLPQQQQPMRFIKRRDCLSAIICNLLARVNNIVFVIEKMAFNAKDLLTAEDIEAVLGEYVR